jgi:hypothetical protein
MQMKKPSLWIIASTVLGEILVYKIPVFESFKGLK